MQKITSSFVIVSLFFLIAGCTTASSQKKMQQKVLLLETRYESPDYTVRENAISEATNYRIPEAKSLLIVASQDTHARVRIAAIKGLSTSFPSDDSFEIVLEKASKDQNVNVRYEALRALIPFKAKEAFPVFAKASTDSDWIFREAAIEGIVKIEDAEVEDNSIPYIISALRDQSTNVQIAALDHTRIKRQAIYQEIRLFFFTKDYDKKNTQLLATLKALQGYELDIRVKERVKMLIIHNNKEVRVYALRVLKSEPGSGNK